ETQGARTNTPVSAPAQRRLRRHRHNRAALFFLAPWLIGLFGLTVGPTAVSLLYSFTDFDFLNAPRWIGADNYARMLHDDRFLRSLANTVAYVGLSVPLRLAVALGVAILLKKAVRGVGVYRAAFYLPSLLGGSVAVAVLWRHMFGGDGLVNQLLALIGIEGPAW